MTWRNSGVVSSTTCVGGRRFHLSAWSYRVRPTTVHMPFWRRGEVRMMNKVMLVSATLRAVKEWTYEEEN